MDLSKSLNLAVRSFLVYLLSKGSRKFNSCATLYIISELHEILHARIINIRNMKSLV